MELVAKIAVGLFITMVVIAIVVQMVSKQQAAYKEFVERKKAVSRMTDAWFTALYQNCQITKWKGISRRECKFYEAELKRRDIKI